MNPFGPRSPRPGSRLWIIVIGLGLGLAAIAFSALTQLRRHAIDHQASELRLLSLALTDEIVRGLQGIESGLRFIRVELREAGLPLTGADADRVLHAHAEMMPLVQTLWIVDRSGRVLAASDTTPSPAQSGFSPALDGLAGNAIAVSRPFVGKEVGESSVALAVPFEEVPGTSGGWIVAALPARALLGAFAVAAAATATDVHMAVFRDDGVRLAGSIVATPQLDEETIAKGLSAGDDHGVRRFQEDGDRLFARHSLPHFGLKVLLTRNLEATIVAWRDTAQLTAAGIAILLAVMAASVHLILRADRRRNDAQRELQTHLSRVGKLESLGTLAGGVAHDFNNVLAGIIGYGEIARDEALPGSDQASHLDKVLQAALRGKSLVERILAFSRGGARTSVVFELAPVVEEVLVLLAGSLRPGVVLEQRLDTPGGRLRGDPTQTFEALMNLCTNAIQAMPAGGAMSVRLEHHRALERAVLSHSVLEKGSYLELSVSDSGVGITPETMERLFEPFFTTRAADSGTGLGLAVVHGVVSEFRGAIDVQSTPGHGARFALYFPESIEELGIRSRGATTPASGEDQSILVVDDDPTLVLLTGELLKGLGYRPVGFSDPTDALAAFSADPDRFSAVITDEVMPDLTGTQLTEALRSRSCRIPVLLVTGYGGALLATRAASAGVTRVLAKPLRRAELARALAEILRT